MVSLDGTDGTQWATAANDGSITFVRDRGSVRPVKSAFWVSAPGFVAEPFIADGEGPECPSILSLRAGPNRTARVVDPNGTPVPNTRIVHLPAPDAALEPDAPDGLSVYYRVFETDQDGRVNLPSFPTQDMLQAFSDGTCSSPVKCDGLEDAELVLHSEFRASGQVFLDDSIDDEGVTLTVRYGGDDGVEVGAIDAPMSGSWGPIRLPLMGSTRYWFSLDGGWVVPKKVWVDTPLPGQHVKVDLVGEKGAGLWFQVYGDDRALLPTALVEIHWDDAGVSESTKMTPRGDEYIWVGGCRPGPVNYEVSAPGYATAKGGPMLVPESDPVVWEIQLDRSGMIQGVCEMNGQPVTDFDVIFWPSLASDREQVVSFRDRPDGSFEILDVAIGDVKLMAASKTLAPTAPISTRVTVARPAEVVLELVDSLDGRGLVLDLDSLTPVVGANVELFTTGARRPFQAWGDPTTTDAAGAFTIEGLSTTLQWISVTAEGYAVEWATCAGQAGIESNLGIIYLRRSQPLVLRLQLSRSVDPSQVTVECAAAQVMPTSFSPEGIVRLDGIDPGHYILRIRSPSGNEQQVRLVLAPGAAWDFQLPLYGDRTLEVEVVPAETGALPPDAWVVLSCSVDGFSIDRSLAVESDGRAVFENLPCESASLTMIANGRSQIHATEVVDFAGRTVVEHRLELASEVKRFRVVDMNGAPVPSISVDFYSESGGIGRLMATTNASGRITVGGIDGRFDRAVIFEAERGTAGGIDLGPPGDASEDALLEFHPSTSLHIRYVDGTQAAAGIQARLTVAGHPVDIGALQHSDSNGRVEWPRLNRTEFIVSSSSLRYWPTTSVLMPDASTVHEVQVRGLGDLEVKVTGSAGEALVGARVELWSVEFEAGVAEWLADGRVQASASSLRTDGSGAIEFSGLPRGEYSARVTTTDGRVWSGEIVVTAGALKRAAVRVP
ncbi:MAG: hypothetical protein ACI8QZ_000374 [Chlamydiales bacterium]|jgi:hypothetical protein